MMPSIMISANMDTMLMVCPLTYMTASVAVNATGQMDVMFIVTAPTFEEWGKFWDNYSGSPAEAVDIQNREKIMCPDSALWEAVKIE